MGVALIAIGGTGILLGLLAKSIPTKWPVSPIKRDADPALYWFHIGGYSLMVLVGAVLAK
jgi:hypothetical protein